MPNASARWPTARPMRPGADDQQLGAGELEPQPAIGGPASASRRCGLRRRLGQAAGDGEQQRHREVGGGVGQDVGRDADRDPAGGGGGEVDVVAADGVVGDRARCGAASSSSSSTGRRASTAGRRRRRRAPAAPFRRGLARGARRRRRALGETVERSAGEGAGDGDPGHGRRFCRFGRRAAECHGSRIRRYNGSLRRGVEQSGSSSGS